MLPRLDELFIFKSCTILTICLLACRCYSSILRNLSTAFLIVVCVNYLWFSIVYVYTPTCSSAVLFLLVDFLPGLRINVHIYCSGHLIIETVHYCQTVFGCELPSVLLVTRYDKFIKKLACNPL